MAGAAIADPLFPRTLTQNTRTQVETSENAWVVLVSYLCMLVYVSLALGRCPDLVGARAWRPTQSRKIKSKPLQSTHPSIH